MCKRKRAEGLDKRSTHQGPAKAGPATARGWQHILYPEQQAQANHYKKKKKNIKTLKQRNLLPLLLFLGITFVIYMEFEVMNFCKMGGMSLRTSKSGHVWATAESWKTCSGISSANLLTPQPPRVKSSSVPSPSLAVLWSFGHTAPLHLTAIYSTGEATFCLP